MKVPLYLIIIVNMVSNKDDSCCPTLIDYYHLSNLLGYKTKRRDFSFTFAMAPNRPEKFSTFFSFCKVSFLNILFQ